jgi:hypothetical protein
MARIARKRVVARHNVFEGRHDDEPACLCSSPRIALLLFVVCRDYCIVLAKVNEVVVREGRLAGYVLYR